MIKTLSSSPCHVAALVIAGALAALTPAVAAKPQTDEAPSIQVPLRGIDLSTSEGVKLAHNKARAAAHVVCPTSNGVRDLTIVADERACYRKAVVMADTQIETLRQRQQMASSNTVQTAMVTKVPTIVSAK